MNPSERIAEIMADRKRRRETKEYRHGVRGRTREIHEAILKARKIEPRLPDESDHDHARRLGLLAERGAGSVCCAWCSGLSHRRPERGPCRGCGKRFAPEMIERVIPDIQSSAGAMVDVGGTGHIGLRGARPHAKKRQDGSA
jgi:hypothetical protein